MSTRRRFRAPRWVLPFSVAAVLLVATLLRFWKLESSSFGFDAAALTNLAAQFVSTGVLPAEGMVSSVGLNNPPLAVYLISLPVLFSRNPVSLIGFVALVNVLSVWACYWLTRRYWGPWEGVLAALLLACSPWAVYYSRGVWAQDLLLPGVILFFALLLHWLLDGRAWALSAAIIALALLVQIHFAALALLPVLVVVLLANRLTHAWACAQGGPASRSRFWVPVGVGLAVSIALYLPYLVALTQSDPVALRGLLSGSSGAPRAAWNALQYALMNIGGLNIHALTGPEQFRRFLAGLLPLNYWPDRIEEALVVLSAVYLLMRCWRRRADRTALARDGVLLLWLTVPVLFFELLPTETYPHYLVPLYPAPYIVLAVAVFDIGREVARSRATQESRPFPKAVFTPAVLALVVLAGWQSWLTIRLYDFVDIVDTPGGLGTPARVYRDVGRVIDQYATSHPQTEVVALCPGQDPRWADPRWDECPAVLEFVAGQKQDLSYMNYTGALPAIPEQDVDLLVVLAPGQDAVADELSRYAQPLAASVPVRDGVGAYRFYVLYNDFRDVAARLKELGAPGDAVWLSASGQADVFKRFYQGPLPVVEAAGSPGNPEATAAGLARAIDQYSRVFVVYKGAENGDPGGAIDNWLSEHAFKAFDTWLGDVRLALYAAPAPDGVQAVPIGADLGGQFRLVASDIAPRDLSVKPGEVLQVLLNWQILRGPEADYSSFLQLVGADGRVVAQSDSLLRHAAQPTYLWEAGSTVATRRGLLVPPEAKPGRYELITGLYRADQAGLPRLSGPNGDFVRLAEIEVR
ncbi:MAG: glycosyltransferase family 39 protein [Nitrososphaerales archaeon]